MRVVNQGWAAVGSSTPAVFAAFVRFILRTKERGRIGLVVLILLLVLDPQLLLAQETAVSLTVRLRDAEGAAVSGEPVILERLPEETAVSLQCTTDAAGECTWQVGRGLYQLRFAHPLDPVSAVAVAEGGLRGLGVTVGEEAITYTFTLAGDDHVYFDAAPEAAVPIPIIPALDHHHGGWVATPVPALTATTTVTGSLASGTGADAAEEPLPPPGQRPLAGLLRLLGFLAAGLALGGILHLWSRRRGETAVTPETIGDQTAVKSVASGDETAVGPSSSNLKTAVQPKTEHSAFRTPHSAFPNPEDSDA